MLNADARRVGRYRQDLLCRCRQLRDGLACAGRVHRDVYGAGVGRAISIGHVKSAGQWCEMLRATRSARASVIVWPDSSRPKKAPWFARCRPAVDRLIPRWAA